MRKWLILVVVAGFISSCYLIINRPEKSDALTILSIEQTDSRLITDSQETIDIPLYFSKDNSFFIDKDNISYISISDVYNTLEVNIKAIVKKPGTYNYNDTDFYLYVFSLDFSNLSMTDVNMNLSNTSLNISYVNDVKYSFSIGDKNLYFSQVNENSYLSYSNLYAIYNSYADNYINGIVIKFENLPEKEIDINCIDINVDKFNLDI